MAEAVRRPGGSAAAAFLSIQSATSCRVCRLVLYLRCRGAFANGQHSWSIGLGVLLLALGQLLNWSVFSLLGKEGVFYGNRFGYRVEWRQEFPFSLFEHPQYAGALLSIWGFFLIMRFPHEDWYWLPLLETAYYAIGAYWERDVKDDESATRSSRAQSRDRP